MNKGNREQKPITKKLAEFHNQLVLLTMFWQNLLKERQIAKTLNQSYFKPVNLG